MTKSMRFVFFVIVFLLISLSGCAPASAQVPPASAPVSTDTTSPTDLPVPTNTPIPTRTPIPPTATIPAPEKSSEYLEDIQVVKVDTFDNPSGNGWGLSAGKITNGKLEVLGKDWNGLVREGSLKDNQGIIIDFTYSRGSVFEMLVDNGVWWTEPYKRFGIYVDNNYARVNVWAGQNGLGGASLTGNLRPKPDTDYSLMLTVLPEGEFLGVIWDPADPSKTIRYREKIGNKWADLTWQFKIGADKGTILFDNFREIKFSSAKKK